jgi:MerR family mercuric resistance operon transcriptional regulator
MAGMTIGKLAEHTGVSIDTVRFYERKQLIDEPARTSSNYRIYPESDITRLKFIIKAKDLGFSLTEIKELLALRCDPSASKADVKNQVETKISAIKQKIIELTRIVSALEHMASECDGHGHTSDCPILEALESDSEENHGKHH